ncbi:anthranilate synthase component II [Microbacterium gorillae]|uniref:anthranilate synthase component II n=1 Tax=Microbacterium gorillae TaxID=1231063 RepID=UPI00058C12AC|nr:aminodeoxychorismate/anthranilate synthase component II [Microbacterium gorillae]
MSPSSSGRHVLVVDNHDSFVHTLVGYLRELDAHVRVVESDEIADPEESLAGVDGVMLSPGPGAPQEAGASVALVLAAERSGTPLLGVCLGHQAIAVTFRAIVRTAPEPMHGRCSMIRHDRRGLFHGLPGDLMVGRYHSLAVDERTLPSTLHVTARAEDGVVMGISHRTAPIHGVQFHPESVLTEGGYRLLGNWLAMLGDTAAPERGALLRPHVV